MFLAAMIPLFALYVAIGIYYRYAERDLKRINSIRASPMYSLFSETLEGVSIIRSFRVEAGFIKEIGDLIAARNRAYYYMTAVQQFAAMYMDFIGACIVMAGVFAALHAHQSGHLSSALAGLCVTYALQIQNGFMWIIRNYNSMEINMVSFERVAKYIDHIPEPPGSVDPPADWPSQGRVEFKNVKLKYGEKESANPPVLGGTDPNSPGFCMTVKGGERVGLVGRTGAGKSTIAASLFRLQDAFEGEILVDGVNILRVAPDTLRDRMSIVTQEPMLFSDTLRKNLDPREECDDVEIWNVLRQTHLFDKVQKMNGQLESEVSGNGDNFSVGERQLLSLARALLRKSRILVLDEATASIDIVSDKIIQDTVRAMEGVTIISIAHRIATILEYDRVAVLSHGEMLEYDSPAALLASKASAFSNLHKGM
jgi:ATP-binding cassette subfamily C (CFTR/MRP) protein 1